MVLKAYEGPNPVCWYRIIRLRSISIVVWLVIKFTRAKYKNISSYKWSHYRYLYPLILFILMTARHMGSSLSWSYGSWIYSYLCNQCLLPLTLWVRIPLGEMYSIQHYVIKFVSDLRQVGGFLQVLRFPPPITLTATI